MDLRAILENAPEVDQSKLFEITNRSQKALEYDNHDDYPHLIMPNRVRFFLAWLLAILLLKVIALFYKAPPQRQ